jgi:hypothetical protein
VIEGIVESKFGELRAVNNIVSGILSRHEFKGLGFTF